MSQLKSGNLFFSLAKPWSSLDKSKEISSRSYCNVTNFCTLVSVSYFCDYVCESLNCTLFLSSGSFVAVFIVIEFLSFLVGSFVTAAVIAEDLDILLLETEIASSGGNGYCFFRTPSFFLKASLSSKSSSLALTCLFSSYFFFIFYSSILRKVRLRFFPSLSNSSWFPMNKAEDLSTAFCLFSSSNSLFNYSSSLTSI